MHQCLRCQLILCQFRANTQQKSGKGVRILHIQRFSQSTQRLLKLHIQPGIPFDFPVGKTNRQFLRLRIHKTGTMDTFRRNDAQISLLHDNRLFAQKIDAEAPLDGNDDFTVRMGVYMG